MYNIDSSRFQSILVVDATFQDYFARSARRNGTNGKKFGLVKSREKAHLHKSVKEQAVENNGRVRESRSVNRHRLFSNNFRRLTLPSSVKMFLVN